MLILPAIDLKDGHCVRLLRGDYDRQTRYSDDAVGMAQTFADTGIKRLHIVDLDGARQGQPVHLQIVGDILRAVPELEVQLGGGIRNMDSLNRWMDAGLTHAILGTAAVHNPDFLAEACATWRDRIIVALDSRDGMVSVGGWLDDSGIALATVAARLASLPLHALLHTDIQRDGTLSGLRLESGLALAQQQPHPVYVAGGVHTLADVQAAKASGHIAGMVFGRALYEGTLDLRAAVQAGAG